MIDKFAVFCTAKSETILANDEIRGSNQRLESIIRADNNSAAEFESRRSMTAAKITKRRIRYIGCPRPLAYEPSKKSGGPADQGDLSFYTCGGRVRKKKGAH